MKQQIHMKRKLSLLVAVVCLCGGRYNAQAQLILDVYPSQDNPTSETLWIFSGSSSVASPATLRTSSTSHSSADGYIRRSGNNYNTRDTFKTTGGNLYAQNFPTNAAFTLSALTPSSLTFTNKNYNSLTGRLNAVFKRDAIFLPNNVTNTPTISFGVGSTLTIDSVYMHHYNGGDNHDLGIRVSDTTGADLVYNSGASMRWFGAGTINKPIGDFRAGSYRSQANSIGSFFPDQGALVRVHSQVIPEPEEYALVFGLFALGFVFFHRWQRKRRQQAATS